MVEAADSDWGADVVVGGCVGLDERGAVQGPPPQPPLRHQEHPRPLPPGTDPYEAYEEILRGISARSPAPERKFKAMWGEYRDATRKAQEAVQRSCALGMRLEQAMSAPGLERLKERMLSVAATRNQQRPASA